MKTVLAYCLLSTFLVCLLSTSCQKNNPGPSKQKLAQLSRTWKVIRVTQTGVSMPLYQNPLPAGEYIIEDYSRYRLTFPTSDRYQRTSQTGSSETGSWALAAGETKLVFDAGVEGKELTCDLVELNETSLKLRYAENSAKTGNRELLMELTPAN
jgi:hypothetical protein